MAAHRWPLLTVATLNLMWRDLMVGQALRRGAVTPAIDAEVGRTAMCGVRWSATQAQMGVPYQAWGVLGDTGPQLILEATGALCAEDCQMPEGYNRSRLALIPKAELGATPRPLSPLPYARAVCRGASDSSAAPISDCVWVGGGGKAIAPGGGCGHSSRSSGAGILALVSMAEPLAGFVVSSPACYMEVQLSRFCSRSHALKTLTCLLSAVAKRTCWRTSRHEFGGQDLEMQQMALRMQEQCNVPTCNASNSRCVAPLSRTRTRSGARSTTSLCRSPFSGGQHARSSVSTSLGGCAVASAVRTSRLAGIREQVADTHCDAHGGAFFPRA